jgi:branched-chain amino acid transport system substrate-binding protein
VGDKAGQFTVNYQSLDDSSAAAGKWDGTQTAAYARKAAEDPKAVYYIGEFNSGASQVSIPILNQAGTPQVSPANTAVGLTTNNPGSSPGEPQKYYPTGKRTYLRIVPRDAIQGPAGAIAMKQAGCTNVAIANDKEAYGAGLAKKTEITALNKSDAVDAKEMAKKRTALKRAGEPADSCRF